MVEAFRLAASADGALGQVVIVGDESAVEVRRLIRDLAGEHTIILSTHILPEVSMTCERVIIINQGKIVLSRSLRDLDAPSPDQESLLLELEAPTDVSQQLTNLEGVHSLEPVAENGVRRYRLLCDRGSDVRPRIASFVVQQGWRLMELRTLETNLEEIYLRVVSSEGSGA